MIERKLHIVPTESIFLFGARGTGKTTLLHSVFDKERTLFIDLLQPAEEDVFSRRPETLEQRIGALSPRVTTVVIDEIQKVPKLLNLVHKLIESTELTFVLTGSSSRKLKRGAANLLAGRAIVHTLFPFTSVELGESFVLLDALKWGTLPKISNLTTDRQRENYLRSYALTYLKEEIQEEQIVRNLDPFRQFLEVAAQCNGQIINYTKIAEDTGTDPKTVISYFSILEDTLIGYLLAPFHHSIRKRQKKNPKFYFFDTGVKRALDRTLSLDLTERTYGFGNAFEHFIIIEIMRLAAYSFPDWRFSYLNTPAGAEIDLIIDRPGLPTALIEIKSSDSISQRDVKTLNLFFEDFDNAEAFCICREMQTKKIGKVRCVNWKESFGELGLKG